jgi:predicted nuclease of predicted toxin-antitoxin system
MRLCANENVPGDCVTRLRMAGHDVLWIRQSAPGSSDEAVLARAQSEGRLLITFDKDFGELVFRRGAEASRGIVLFRIAQPSSAVVAERVTSVLASRTDWEGRYSVVDETVVRMRPLPPRL